MSSIRLYEIRLRRLQSHGKHAVSVFDPTPLSRISLLEKEFGERIPEDKYLQPSLYQPGVLLCGQKDAGDVVARISARFGSRFRVPPPDVAVGGNVATIQIPSHVSAPKLALDLELQLRHGQKMMATDDLFELRGSRLRDLIKEVASDGTQPPIVSPNHIFTATPICSLGPASDPRVPNPLRPPTPHGDDGADVTVAVIDSGMLADYRSHSWLDDDRVIVLPDGGSIEPTDAEGDGYIDFPAGHGTFVAGVVRSAAPGATIIVEKLLDKQGKISETELGQRLHEVMAAEPDIINLSLTGQTYTGQPPIALQPVWDQVRAREGNTVVVASAGNAGVSTPFWPAADPIVVGVGAVDHHCEVAEFSNFGEWVKVFALGVDVQNAYTNGQFIADEPDHHGRVTTEIRNFRHGIAEWSGTSFAAPLVSGMIAAEMSRSHTDPTTAKDAVLATARDMKGSTDGRIAPYRCLPPPA